jgi:hypothetical protein
MLFRSGNKKILERLGKLEKRIESLERETTIEILREDYIISPDRWQVASPYYKLSLKKAFGMIRDHLGIKFSHKKALSEYAVIEERTTNGN